MPAFFFFFLNLRALIEPEDKEIRALLLVTNKWQVTGLVESDGRAVYTFIGLEKVRLPAAAGLHGKASIYRCALLHSAGQDFSGSTKERDLGSGFAAAACGFGVHERAEP